MAERASVKYLDYAGLKSYNQRIKDYYANNTLEGVVGFSDTTGKLASPIKIELKGAVTGDMSGFDGSSDRTIMTTLTPLSGTHSISVTGNAGTATNFESAKSIFLTGDVTGNASGGNTADGWTITSTISDASVTNIKLAGSISNDKLVNHSITIGTTEVQLGGTITTITADLVGNVTGNADTATKASQDASGNVIVTTYATKAELEQVKSAIRFKGSVEKFSDLPTNPENGDIYNVLNDPNPDLNKSWIWSEQDKAWSVFGSAYGPATSETFGLVKTGSNITNTAGTISVSQSNVDDALGYQAIKAVKVNGTTLIPNNRVVNVEVPTDYATQDDIDASFTYSKISGGLGFDPINVVQVNGTALTKTNNTVNVDLGSYATKTWTNEQIEQKLTSLYVFKGSVQTYGDLLNITGQKVGHTYNVVKGNDPETEEPTWPSFADGTNFAWDGDEWDALGGTLDLSNYYKKSEVDDLLKLKANKTHSHNDLYYTKTEVDQKVTDLKSWVNTRISEYFQAASDSGIVNDIRTYASYDSFPAKGISDVQYVAADTKVEYQWKWDDEQKKTGHYEAINETASQQDIEDIFK